MSGRSWEALPEGRDGLEGPPRGSGGPSGEPGGVGRSFWRAGRGREGRKRLGVSLEGLAGVMRPSRKGREELGGLPGEPGRVRRPSRRVRKGREVQERLAVPPIGPEGFGRPSWRAWWGREALPEDREESGGMEGVGSPPRGLGG